MRNIGDMAEHMLSMWCSEAGLTVNTSHSDEMGWDHFIEFPFSNVINSSQVYQTAPKCKVQVKATDNTSRKLQVTLSNLRKMAVDPLPCFFLFIEYDGKSTAQRAYLKLVDKDLIHQILKKVHTINASPKENKFNKKTMLVKYSEDQKLAELSGGCFKESISKYFGNDFNQFIADRKKFIENVGYEDGAVEISFEAVGSENLEKLINVSLGIEENVPIEQIVAKDKRFGIPTIKPNINGSSALLSMPDVTPTTQMKLSFRKCALETSYSFDVDVYFQPFVSDLNSPLCKSRFKGDFFDAVLRGGGNNFSFVFNFANKSYDVHYLRKALQFTSLLLSGESFEVFAEGKGGKHFIGNLKGQNQSVDYKVELESLDKIIQILTTFGFDTELKLNLAELDRLVSSVPPFYDFLFKSDRSFKVSFGLTEGELDSDKSYIMLGCLKFRIGDHTFFSFYDVEGTPCEVLIDDDKRFELTTTNIKIEKKFFCHVDDLPSDDDVYQTMKSLEASYSGNSTIILNK